MPSNRPHHMHGVSVALPLPPSILRQSAYSSPATMPVSKWGKFTRRLAKLLKPSSSSAKAPKGAAAAPKIVKSVSFGDIHYHEPISHASALDLTAYPSLPRPSVPSLLSIPSSSFFRVFWGLCWHEILIMRAVSRYFYFHAIHEDAFLYCSVFEDIARSCFVHQLRHLAHASAHGQDEQQATPAGIDNEPVAHHPYAFVSLDQLLLSVPFLRSMNLSNYALTNRMINTLGRFPLLHEISLAYCRPPACMAVNRILPALRGRPILSLDLSNSILYFPDHFNEIAHFPLLLSLQIARTRVQVDCFLHLPQLASLRALNISHNSSLTDFTLTTLATATALQSLYLDDCHFSLAALKGLLANLPSLIHLSFSLPANSCDDSFFVSLASSHPALTLLHVSRLHAAYSSALEPTGLSDTSIYAIGKLKALEQLKIEGLCFSAAAMTDCFTGLTGLIRVAWTVQPHEKYSPTFKALAGLAQLESLYIYNAATVMVDEYFDILMRSSRLNYINISEWKRLSEGSKLQWELNSRLHGYNERQLERYEAVHTDWLNPGTYTGHAQLKRLPGYETLYEEYEEIDNYRQLYADQKENGDASRMSFSGASMGSATPSFSGAGRITRRNSLPLIQGDSAPPTLLKANSDNYSTTHSQASDAPPSPAQTAATNGVAMNGSSSPIKSQSTPDSPFPAKAPVAGHWEDSDFASFELTPAAVPLSPRQTSGSLTAPHISADKEEEHEHEINITFHSEDD